MGPWERAVDRGFVYVVMDERGTGASFGDWPAPLSNRALEDAGEVLDWIASQSWSNGKVGATGVSYPGMAAQQMASLGHPALRAIAPMSDAYDLYGDLIFPGGVFNEGFLQGWSDVVYALDRTTELELGGDLFQLQPVDEDPSGHLLGQAVADHAGNLDAHEAIGQITYRDDPFAGSLTLDHVSTSSRIRGAPGVAVYQWGSWMDAASADGVIRGFMESSGPRRAVLGAWTHDLWETADPYGVRGAPADPPGEYQWEEALNFFDDVLRKGKILTDRTFRYYTLGEGGWKDTSTWPIPGTQMVRLYLAEGGRLTTSAPTSPTGEDVYEVDFEAASSPDPRWLAPLFSDVWYPSGSTEDQRLLVYETEPMEEDVEVTGYPVVNLHLSSTHPDGAVLVYLEDQRSGFRTTYLTEGVLRVIHRKVGEDPAAWDRPTPYHSYLAADAEPLVPGQVAQLSFGLQPISALIRAGHRIRIAIAAHDTGVFRRIPTHGTPTLRVHRNATHPSWIEIPVVPR